VKSPSTAQILKIKKSQQDLDKEKMVADSKKSVAWCCDNKGPIARPVVQNKKPVWVKLCGKLKGGILPRCGGMCLQVLSSH